MHKVKIGVPQTLVLIGLWFGLADAAQARPRLKSGSEHEIAGCIRAAANGKSWLEKTLWGLRDQEGGWVGAAVLNTNGTHDLGPLQVNTWWVSRLASLTGQSDSSVRHWLRHDPCFNIQAARFIFLSALARSRDYWKAVGIYHSPTEWRQRRYAAGVASKLQRRFGATIFHSTRRIVFDRPTHHSLAPASDEPGTSLPAIGHPQELARAESLPL